MEIQMTERKNVILKIIPKPKERTRVVLEPRKGVIPVIKGIGDIDLQCGKCKTCLVEGTVEGQIQNIVIRCPNCKSYNEILFHVERWKPKFPS